MLHYKTIEPATLELLKKLLAVPVLPASLFCIAGNVPFLFFEIC